MFTVKAFVGNTTSNMHYGYEAESYTVDETTGRVDFVRRDGHGQCLQVGAEYSRIVIENAYGKTVENVSRTLNAVECSDGPKAHVERYPL